MDGPVLPRAVCGGLGRGPHPEIVAGEECWLQDRYLSESENKVRRGRPPAVGILLVERGGDWTPTDSIWRSTKVRSGRTAPDRAKRQCLDPQNSMLRSAFAPRETLRRPPGLLLSRAWPAGVGAGYAYTAAGPTTVR